MDPQKIQIEKKHHTLLVALHARAVDSQADDGPILGDPAAKRVVDQIDYDFDDLQTPHSDIVGIAIRSRELDNWTRDFIALHPDAVVLHLGCGLDGRVHRVDPPAEVTWVDLDFPEIIELVRRLYPSRDAYQTVGADVTDLAWLDRVPTGRPVIVVAESLSMFLTEETFSALVNRVIELYPTGEFAFNAFNPATVKLLKLHPTFRKTGAVLTWGIDEPSDIEPWNPKLKFVTEWFTVSSPDVAKMSKKAQRTSRTMLKFKTLRRADRLLRYRFG
jgi:O-methyltransferase involved in polyketide biosynthesis